MPEVCEVCLTAMFLKRKLVNKNIISIDILGGRYSRYPLPGLEIGKKMLPIKVNNIDSKGKFLWFELIDDNNNKLYIMNTFGLVGKWGFEKIKHSNIKFTIKSKKNKIYDLYYSDYRNFGTFKITTNKNILTEKLNMLGPDFLKESFTDAEFKNRISQYLKKGRLRSDKKIVVVLMDQKSLGSGLGNYLVPEILYKAKISPHETIGNIYLNNNKINRLVKAIKYIVKSCYINNNTSYVEHLKQFLKKNKKRVKKNNAPDYHKSIKIKNKPFKFKVYREKMDPDGNKVIGENIIKGRTTYWVPSIQK